MIFENLTSRKKSIKRATKKNGERSKEILRHRHGIHMKHIKSFIKIKQENNPAKTYNNIETEQMKRKIWKMMMSNSKKT